jgi:hypothetical protein
LCRGWARVALGGSTRHVNGILGLLCRLHFPGLVRFSGSEEPAYTWEHYIAFSDVEDRDGRVFANKAARVKAELWVSFSRTTLLNTSHSLYTLEILYIHCTLLYMQDFFRCQEGYEARAARVAHEACKKLVKDMHYEARIQAIVTYHAGIRVKVTKTEARNMRLTREQYLGVNIEH